MLRGPVLKRGSSSSYTLQEETRWCSGSSRNMYVYAKHNNIIDVKNTWKYRTTYMRRSLLNAYWWSNHGIFTKILYKTSTCVPSQPGIRVLTYQILTWKVFNSGLVLTWSIPGGMDLTWKVLLGIIILIWKTQPRMISHERYSQQNGLNRVLADTKYFPNWPCTFSPNRGNANISGRWLISQK